MSSSLSARPTPAQLRQSLLLGALALVLFVIGNYQQSVIGFDSRFVMFAQEMLRHGPSFFPTTYGEPYADYSATSTLFSYLLSLPFGQVTSLTAWLPTSIASAVIVTLMYRLLAPFSTRWALASVALLLLSVTFISETRAVSLDQMLAAVAFAVFYLGYAHDHFGAPRRLAGLFALLLLGFAIRGPIGLVVPTGMLCSYYLLSGQYRRLFAFGFAALALLGICIGLLLWLAQLSGGAAFVQDVIRMQVTGRIDGSEGSSSVVYYFTSSLGNYAMAYPLAILAGLAVVLNRAQPRGPALRLLGFCAAAGLIVMVGLSIPMAKKARYMLPMLPMAAIIAAYPFQGAQGRVFAGLRALIHLIWLLLPALSIGGVLYAHKRFPELVPPPAGLLGLLAALQLIAVAALVKPGMRVVGPAACAVLATWASYIMVLEPAERGMYDTRQFSQAVYRQVRQAPAPLVLYGMGKDAKAIKFMVNIDADLRPVFSDAPDQLAAQAGPAYVMMSDSDLRKLPPATAALLAPVLSGMFDKDGYQLLRLAP
ncbi:glycosyltransferase family 39 protein [Pseudomonas abieticivorans]|uniref:glycosyltransferase family 39 protein n=1 Tax=Pseudomonas abieticivorans TaxID=2931382 RepID=UPI0020BE5C8E|nr:glycosyltransferase family 39 protein [Pseudomonas sp. PIA16]